MLLYIVRHAWAGEHGDPRYPDDGLRPLTDEGRKRFSSVVDKLVGRGFAPTAIATSPLVRCRQTAEIISQLTPGKPPFTLLAALEPGADLTALLDWTTEHADDEVAWVGHAPDVGRLVAELIGGGAASIRLAKGAVAAIEFDQGVHRGMGELQWLATAKLLGS